MKKAGYVLGYLYILLIHITLTRYILKHYQIFDQASPIDQLFNIDFSGPCNFLT